MGSLIIRVITLGCKVNQCESASIVATLRLNNYSASEGLGPADVYILNTCSVTAEADKKSRQYIAKMQKLNPSCRIIVIGCSSQNSPEKFNKKNVVAIGGTTNKSDFVLDTIKRLYNNIHYNTLSDIILLDKSIDNVEKCREYCYEAYPIFNKTRAFIKIQDGCNRFCTYCIIPYLRGRSRSRSIQDIVNEIDKIQSNEVVITGIDVSEYGKDIGTDLPSLLASLSGRGMRIRLSSLECEAVNEPLLDVMVKGDYCPHFHLSLQSGDNTVLKTMNRRYDTDYFFSKVQLIRKYFPLAGITTDVIVGFPTETDEFFENSCKFILKCEFSDIHVFPYSKRDGTLAAKKYDTIHPDIVKQRVNKLLAVKNELKKHFMCKNVGEVARVYVEDEEDGYKVGYTPNYIKVYSHAPCGEIVNLRLTSLNGNLGMFGE
ncbi:MAG: tRNA (N(6)-L-threonylcarbamoyladenosine(37)-C(2))-methylthiotransferase MtaB [Clostridiales bacterium]|nr:tRNA (N(6)-L-threonylcarbamoyladenosine(37)-C(2))-methylthiotransferase MtaB [Clostridiales bacterium]